MIITNCPNCGALAHTLDKYPYCSTLCFDLPVIPDNKSFFIRFKTTVNDKPATISAKVIMKNASMTVENHNIQIDSSLEAL